MVNRILILATLVALVNCRSMQMASEADAYFDAYANKEDADDYRLAFLVKLHKVCQEAKADEAEIGKCKQIDFEVEFNGFKKKYLSKFPGVIAVPAMEYGANVRHAIKYVPGIVPSFNNRGQIAGYRVCAAIYNLEKNGATTVNAVNIYGVGIDHFNKPATGSDTIQGAFMPPLSSVGRQAVCSEKIYGANAFANVATMGFVITELR